ncbi:MAG: 3-octaprenyl-4-hydroxybenzoate carboxy-lyase, partial [Sphingobacteriales bacterium]|nr:3-octaprenyl-4-hydroxybenzoate carboxy-lyase [Sphingobacteriales bacterium]
MQKIVVAVTGASGSIYAKVLLEKLSKLNNQISELSLLMTTNAKSVWSTELENEDYLNYNVKQYTQQDFDAPFASGSGQYQTMIIIPCSMGTLGRIAQGISNDLIT